MGYSPEWDQYRQGSAKEAVGHRSGHNCHSVRPVVGGRQSRHRFRQGWRVKNGMVQFVIQRAARRRTIDLGPSRDLDSYVGGLHLRANGQLRCQQALLLILRRMRAVHNVGDKQWPKG